MQRFNWMACVALVLACLAVPLAFVPLLVPIPFWLHDLGDALIYYIFPAIPSCVAFGLAKVGMIRADRTNCPSRLTRAAFSIAIISLVINLFLLAFELYVTYLMAATADLN